MFTGMALLISVGNLGGICGSNVYLKKEAPVYHTGFGVCLGFCVMGIIGAFILRFEYKRQNRARDELIIREGGEGAVRSKYTNAELLEMGDLSPFWRYTL
jgi:hypothetical protein